MKKLITLIVMIGWVIGLNAQTYDVVQGSTHTFTVSVNNSVPVAATGYTWSADAALSAIITPTNQATTNITFNGALNATGNVSVYATSSDHNCSGNTVSRTFRIVNQLSVTAILAAIPDICPATTSNPGGGDIPSFNIQFRDVSTGNPVNVTSFTYQIVNPSNVAGAEQSATVGGNSSYNLDLTTAYDNTQTGTYTIRIVTITPVAGNIATYPDGSGSYPNTTVTVNLAPELTW